MPQKTEKLPKVAITKIISLEEMINRLSDRIKPVFALVLKIFQVWAKRKSGCDSEFLAMLELVKQGVVKADQSNNFEDIQIEGENAGVPSYY